ncbi:P-type conjugative transfer protein TrbJ [Bradyrhizobium sp. RDM12]
MRRLGLFGAAGTIAVTLCVTAPARAQWIVFDPNNYVQNVLTAARAAADQQSDHLIAERSADADQPGQESGQPAIFLLQQLQSSIQRTQQLLAQAQRIAYDVQQIDRAFSTSYAPASGSQSSQLLMTNAQSRWQNSVAALQDALRVQAGVVGNLDTNRIQTSALVTSSQGASGALQATQAGNQILALQAQQLADLTATVAAQGRAQSLEAAQRAAAQDQGREQLRRFLTPGQGYQSQDVRMFH